ncbi:ABC transporter substrate-binding protein [Dietzia cinnamea]|uniref:ABC transporter substrate-binding protein n=1 Tax=Dietzia cinnamea TaxID=321318 RepID=UPI00223B8E7B|nr:ABC transporter substrate-binding protein [Dietzia cinnamea]MCT2060498.1 ABC transporter substrate-binding protein [Dietzia cinnamea]MCT2237324.1 ABC transporter substrate-binding protein [Dietzia cinnamea]MCT2301997.1 ABC transporter substrate-binding protein [Dietzia cinnamea]
MFRHHPRTALAALLVTGLALAGCSRGEATEVDAAAEPFANPVTIANCEREATYTEPPQRIISMNDHVTETLIQLGAGDRIVGMGYGDQNDVLPEVADQFHAIPSLAEEYPTWEQIVDLEPDLVVAGMRSAFDEKEGRSRDALESAGINTFLFSEYCGEGFPDLSMLETDFSQLGRVLGVERGARDLTDRIRGQVEDVRATLDAAGVTGIPTFFYDSGEAEPMTIGGVGIGQLIGEYAGADNIFSEGDKPYPKTTWEVLGERQPEAIVVLDYGATSAEDKIAYLRAQPVMATTPAIREDRIVVVPLADFFESSRMATSVETIARELHPHAFGQ